MTVLYDKTGKEEPVLLTKQALRDGGFAWMTEVDLVPPKVT